MFREDSAHPIFVDLHAKDSADQERNTWTAIPWVPPFCFDNSTDNFFGGVPFGPRFFFCGMKTAARIWPSRELHEGARASMVSRSPRFGLVGQGGFTASRVREGGGPMG